MDAESFKIFTADELADVMKEYFADLNARCGIFTNGKYLHLTLEKTFVFLNRSNNAFLSTESHKPVETTEKVASLKYTFNLNEVNDLRPSMLFHRLENIKGEFVRAEQTIVLDKK
jgi:hypothetical protein